jgi:hypothetical protein
LGKPAPGKTVDVCNAWYAVVSIIYWEHATQSGNAAMKSGEHGKFNEIVKFFLGMELPESVAGRVDFEALPDEARDVIRRMLALMKRSGCPATEITAHMIWLLFTVTPRILPSAWGGRIPPMTAQGRHKKLDAYVCGDPGPSTDVQPVFIDLGCGFPPVTTVETAGQLPDWRIYGIDPGFARYVVYDRDGRYACFNREGRFQYVQSPAKPLNDTPEAVRVHFQGLFADLHSRLGSEGDDGDRRVVEWEGRRLVVDHARDYETENLRFIKAGVEDLELPPARFIRCMNMLLYFEKDVRERMLSAMAGRLGTGGLLLAGFNHPFGIYARYAVYKKSADGLRPCEFAFSMENLRPLGVGPWLALSEEDRDAVLLADLTGAIRSDRQFWPDFNRQVDHLREALGICRRGDDGFHHFTREVVNASPQVLFEKAAALWAMIEKEGYKAGAVAALRRAGYTAWENRAGDIAVVPPEGALDTAA